MLMPGIVGLGILDSFALETPLITIDIPGHGPEICYLKNNENGVLLDSATNQQKYAEVVVELLTNEDQRLSLVHGCKKSRNSYTIEEMVENFTKGVLSALRAKNT